MQNWCVSSAGDGSEAELLAFLSPCVQYEGTPGSHGTICAVAGWRLSAYASSCASSCFPSDCRAVQHSESQLTALPLEREDGKLFTVAGSNSAHSTCSNVASGPTLEAVSDESQCQRRTMKTFSGGNRMAGA